MNSFHLSKEAIFTRNEYTLSKNKTIQAQSSALELKAYFPYLAKFYGIMEYYPSPVKL